MWGTEQEYRHWGAVNLALPFVLIAQALNALASIGGVTVTAIRFGRGDKEGAQNAFMHSFTINLCVGLFITLMGCVFNKPICSLLGASENYVKLVQEYVFWWALFAVANSLSLNLQSFCRNDGAPGLVAVTNVVSTSLNIFLDWLFVFPMQKGVMGAAVATGISQIAGLLVISTHFLFKKGNLTIRKYKPQLKLYRKIVFRGLPEAIAQFSTPVTTLCMNYTLMATFGDIGINAFSIISYLSSFTMAVFFGATEGMQPLFGQAYGAKEDDNLRYYYRAGQLISIIGSTLCVAVYVIFPHVLCKLFGADAVTLDFTAAHMWEYCWGFIVGSINTLLSAYFYSTKRSGQAITLNVVRSLVMNTLVITFLPKIFGSMIVWHTFGIYEVLVLIIAIILKKSSERNGIVYR
ncbi:MAG: MATE family efflux transporter [Lachnospiraceae bacterium]|nr:MATE family efflux transporter [Lachnospiraceae bacterium]MDY4617536.1 MATE family efflux transporter [Lachnospiraceae bacterium]